MFNLKISGIIAGTAFILSLLIGIMSRSSFPALILRPFIFGVAFFLFTAFVSLMVGHFLPELLEERVSDPEITMPGSRINISEETPAVPGMVYARPDDSDEEMGDISQITSAGSKPFNSGLEGQNNLGRQEISSGQGMDQTEQNGYTSYEGSKSSSDSGDSFDTLPDLESLVGAFMPSSMKEDEEVQEYSSSEPSKRSPIGNKAQKMDADFNPKELAAGIRTILKKEEG